MKEYINKGNDLYFDLLTIRDFYKQRYDCVNNIENYIKSKILDYFNNVVSILNTAETQLTVIFIFNS